MSSKRFTHPNQHPNVTFILDFVSKNYERRTVDEKTCQSFLYFIDTLIDSLTKQSNTKEIRTILKIISTTFYNFEELNQNSKGLSFFLKLFKLSFNIIQKIFSKIDKYCGVEAFEIFFPLFQTQKKQQLLADLEKSIADLSIIKSMNEIESLIKGKKPKPMKIDPEIEGTINNLAYLYYQNDNLLTSYLKSHIHVEGKKYLDILLDMIAFCIFENKFICFENVLKVYKCVAIDRKRQRDNVISLVNTIMKSSNTTQFFSIIHREIKVEKYYGPNELFSICFDIFNAIFQENFSNQNFNTLDALNSLKCSFGKEIILQQKSKQKMKKIIQNILKCLIVGKKIQTKKKKEEVLIINSPQGKDQSLVKEKSSDGFRIIELNEEKQKAHYQLLKKSKSEKIIDIEDIDDDRTPLSNEQIQKLSKKVKLFLNFLMKNGVFLEAIKSCDPRKVLKLLSNLKDHYSHHLLDFIVSIVPRVLEVDYVDLQIQAPMVQFLAIRVLQDKCFTQQLSSSNAFNIYKKIHQILIEGRGLNYHFVVCSIIHRYIPNECLSHVLESSRKYVFSEDISELGINLSLLISCLQPISNVSFTTKRIFSQIEKLSLSFSLDLFFVDDKESRFLMNQETLSDEEIQLSTQLIEIVSQTNKLIDKGIQKLQYMNLNSFYKIIVALNAICPSLNQFELFESQMLNSLAKMRRNNKFSIILTLQNQLGNQIESFMKNKEKSSSSMVVIYHLFKKSEILLQNTKSLQEEKNHCFRQTKIQQFEKNLITYLSSLGKNPSKKLLELLNSSFDHQNQICIGHELLLSFMKDGKMIKFYSEVIKQTQLLELETLKTGLKVVSLMFKYFKNQMSDEASIRKVSQLKLRYDIYDESFTQKQKIVSKMQTKMKLLSICSGNQNEYFEEIADMLEDNHEILGQILLEEQNLQGKQQSQIQEGQTFMDYLLKILVSKNISQKSSNLRLLCLLSTIISNNKKILSIAQIKVEQKMRGKKLSSLIISRSQEFFNLVKVKQNIHHDFIEGYLEESLKIYLIFGEIWPVNEHQFYEIMVQLIAIDDLASPALTLSLLREMVNVSQIHNLSLNQKSQEQLIKVVFSYIKKIKVYYFSGERKFEVNFEASLSSTIIWFVSQFFGLKKKNELPQNYATSIKEEGCLLNKKGCNFFCLSCQSELQICINCALYCHANHPVQHSQNSQQKSKSCQCRYFGECKIENKKKSASQKKNEDPSSRESQKMRAKKIIQLYEEDHFEISEMIEDDPNLRQLFPPRLKRGLSMDDLLRIKSKAEGRILPNLFSYERSQIRNIENHQKVDEEDEEEQEIQMEEDEYDEIQNIEQNSGRMEEKGKIYTDESQLLGMFIRMTTKMCKMGGQEGVGEQSIAHHIKIGPKPVIADRLILDTWEICNSATFSVKIRKIEGGLTSPSISKKLIAFNDKLMIIISANSLHVYLREKLYSAISTENKTSGFSWINQHQVQYQPHSIQFCFHNTWLLSVGGLHHLCLFEVNFDGNISRNPINKFSVNNDNINKVKVTKLGIIISLSKEIKVLSYSLKQTLSIQSQNSLIKQWTTYEKNTNELILYILLTDGFIYYVEVAPWTDGSIIINKKLTDTRANRPVGAFIHVKDIPDAGTLLLASFKDKSIGHTLGRVDGTCLEDSNYLKFFNQDLHSLFETYNIMGLTDFFINPLNPKELFIAANMIPPLPDVLSIHRGFLILIKLRLDQPGSNFQVQIVNSESRCQYFEVVKMGEKAVFILSIHEDGSLHTTTINKIDRKYAETEIAALKEKHNSLRKKKSHYKSQNSENNMKKIVKLRRKIKESVSLKQLQQGLDGQINHYSFAEHSEQLKNKQDYMFFNISTHQEKGSVYEIRLTNFEKIITGFTLPFYGDVKILTRQIKNVLQFGLTTEESLYFFAFGTIRIQFMKNEEKKYARESNSEHQKKKRTQIRFQEIFRSSSKEDYLLEKNRNLDIVAFGQNFQSFRAKINNFEERFHKKHSFSLESLQNLEHAVKVLQIFLQNSLIRKEYNLSKELVIEFAYSIRDKMIMNKKQEFCGKNYQSVFNVLTKTLKIFENIQGRKMHIFNDQFHPLRFSTEKKIQSFYEGFKTQISSNDIQAMVRMFYKFALQQPHLLAFYLAKYPSLLQKLQKKVKQLKGEEITEMIIPLYLLGHLTLKYLNYNVDWIIPEICEVVGQITRETKANEELKSRFNRRNVLFSFLLKYENFAPEAWLKNVQSIDGNETSKQNAVIQEAPNLNNFAGFGQLDLDEEAELKLVLELSKRQMEAQQQIQLQNQMEYENPQENEDILSSILLKDIIIHCFKEIDYHTSNIEVNCQKVIVIYVISKLVNQKYQRESDSSGFIFLCQQIKNSMIKLCNQYQIPESNVQSILMLWMKLFSNIYANSTYFQELKNKKTNFQPYETVKQQVIKTLQRLSIEEVHKQSVLPNPLARALNGLKINSSAHFVYGFVFVLQYPCEPNYTLFTLNCSWLFPQNESFYTKTKFKDTIKEGIRQGNVKKIYNAVVDNEIIQIWKEIAEQELSWLELWIEEKKQNWPLALELLTLYHE